MFDWIAYIYLYPYQKLEESHRANVSRVESGGNEDQLIELKQRLMLLEEGYEAEITQVKQQYEEILAAPQNSGDEAVRQKYQKEIEHLRVRHVSCATVFTVKMFHKIYYCSACQFACSRF